MSSRPVFRGLIATLPLSGFTESSSGLDAYQIASNEEIDVLIVFGDEALMYTTN